MLWDVIRDFFVMYIFGGCTSNSVFYGGFFGSFTILSDDGVEETFSYFPFTNSFGFKISNTVTTDYGDMLNYISVGDWLSTTFTIITLILICYMFLRLIIWLFKFSSGLFKW